MSKVGGIVVAVCYSNCQLPWIRSRVWCYQQLAMVAFCQWWDKTAKYV